MRSESELFVYQTLVAAKLARRLSRCMPSMACNAMCLRIPQGVCVAAHGADEFPAFFSRNSGCRAPARVDSPAQAAALVRAAFALRLAPEPSHCSGVVIGAQALAVAHCSRTQQDLCARGMPRALRWGWLATPITAMQP